MNFGGTFFGTAEYLLDGTWDTRVDWGGVIYVPSVDDVQEMKIMTNAFTAQYGWSSGNVVNIVTKGGSNGFHGDAWEFYANDAFDARYYFNNGAQPSFNRNQFGGTIGGPIRETSSFSLPTTKASGNPRHQRIPTRCLPRRNEEEISRHCWAHSRGLTTSEGRFTPEKFTTRSARARSRAEGLIR